MTQDDVAREVGLSRSSVVQIESGKRSVSSIELDRLSYIFGRDIREFVGGSFRESDPLSALFRAEPEVTRQPEVLERLRECLALGHEITNLERLLGLDRDLLAVASYPLSAPRTRWDAVLQGNRIADEERRRLGLGNAPLPDVEELLETQGVRAAMVDLPPDISGFTLSDDRVGLFVIANRKHPFTRRRFSFAHEYGHVVADRDRQGYVSKTSERDELPEVRANSFAACFLMPEAGVRSFVAGLGKGKPSRAHAQLFDGGASTEVEGRTRPGSQTLQLYDVVELAQHFGVSRVSALFRLRNLRLLTEGEFERLRALDEAGQGRRVASLLGYGDIEDSEGRDRFRHRFLTLAFETHRRDEISRSKLDELSKLVGLNPSEIDALLSEGALFDESLGVLAAQ